MTQRPPLLVGPDGWFDVESPQLLAELGDPERDFDTALFAVRNLGYVKLSHHDSLLEVTIHPRNVEARTLQAVQNLLSASTAKLFRIKHLDGDWRVETLTSRREAVVRIFDLCRASPEPTASAATTHPAR